MRDLKKPTAQDIIWKTIRILRDFTIHEVEATAKLPYKSISVYIAALSRAGYILKVGLRKDGSGSAPRSKVWRIVKNTGPKAPVLRRCLLDPNLNTLTEVKDCVPVD
ncbi:MAG: hypothetical protein C4560_02915 [Nitrospiraceae bacterium]|nr:MAG: hypothetical protein C4560_02915 [Nitrospiraceae bacterium]